MENIVCLGTVGCKIGKELEKYKKYKMFYIDDSGKKRKGFLKLNKHVDPEKYEEEYDTEGDRFLKSVQGNVTMVLCGASLVSSASLRILEPLKHRCEKINILYVKPETSLLSETKKLQERVIRNVLQQYARSGVFSGICMIDNEKVAEIVPDVSILEYYDKVNEVIASTYHMIKVFENTESVVDTFSPLRPTSRVYTLSVFDPDQDSEEKSFFSIENFTESRYYYGIPGEVLKNEKSLYRKILNQMKKRLDFFPKVSYGIYETAYDNKIGYAVSYTNVVQIEKSESERSTD